MILKSFIDSPLEWDSYLRDKIPGNVMKLDFSYYAAQVYKSVDISMRNNIIIFTQPFNLTRVVYLELQELVIYKNKCQKMLYYVLSTLTPRVKILGALLSKDA